MTTHPAYTVPLHRACAVALLIEATAVLAAAAWLNHAEPPPKPPTMVMRVERVETPALAPALPPPPPPTPAPPQAQTPPPQVVPPPKAVAKPPQRQVVKQTEAPAPALPQKVETGEVAQPAIEAPPPPSPVAAETSERSAAVVAAAKFVFDGELRAAVQAAVRYPSAAKALGREGRVRVGFDFIDGQVSNIAVVEGSDFPAFDDYAVAAPADARYPTPPPELQHKVLHLLVWVEFKKKSS